MAANLMSYSDTIVYEGYLLKQSQYLQILRKRWIVLKGKHLLCYKEMQVYSNPTETFDLSTYNKIKRLSNTEFELQSTVGEKKNEKKRKFVTKNITDTEKWIDYISAIQCSKNADNHLILPPTTPILIVFQKITQSIGINDDKMSMQYITKLNQKWYYRAIDLLHVNNETWNELKMPIILRNQIFRFVENLKQNGAYIDFKEAIPKQKNVHLILNQLAEENKSYCTSEHIKILKQEFAKLYLLHINKLKMYLDESTWNAIKVPPYLKVIFLQKIHHQFEGQNKNNLENDMVNVNKTEGENDPLFPNIEELKYDLQQVTDQGTMDITMEVCTKLANELLVETDKIANDLQPLFDYNFNRLYHLSKISDDLYNKLLSKAPKYLKKYLYHIITEVRGYETLPFYRYDVDLKKDETKLEEINIDWGMRTDQIFEILEQDLNLLRGELSSDCNLLMTNFYSNLWDWFFIPNKFWKTLPCYNSFEIVRIRIYELMSTLMKKYNIDQNTSIPCLPQQWLKKYDLNLSIDQLLCGGNKTQFTFDGLNWNADTINHTELIKQYMHKNFVGMLQLISEEHCNNNDIWTKYMNDNQIPSHIRFKMNFYSVRGHIQTDDDWLNDYIKKYYANLPPQYVQSTLPSRPRFSVQAIESDSASIKFSVEMKSEIDIDIMNEDEKEEQWIHLVTLSDQTSYLCKSLKANSMYQIRARCKTHALFSSYSVKSFRTFCAYFSNLREMVNKHTKNAYQKDWNLLYQSSRDGLSVNSFWNKCDKKRNTIWVIQFKCKNDQTMLIGGFTSIPLVQNNQTKKVIYETDSKAFMYCIARSNKFHKTVKAAIFPVTKGGENAIRTAQDSFGFGGRPFSKETRFIWFSSTDVRIYITSKGVKPTYEVPDGYEIGSDDKCFTPEEIQVFELMLNNS